MQQEKNSNAFPFEDEAGKTLSIVERYEQICSKIQAEAIGKNEAKWQNLLGEVSKSLKTISESSFVCRDAKCNRLMQEIYYCTSLEDFSHCLDRFQAYLQSVVSGQKTVHHLAGIGTSSFAAKQRLGQEIGVKDAQSVKRIRIL